MARGRQDPEGQAATASFTASSASAGMALLSVSAVLYAAFALDPDGNNVEAVCHTASPED